MRRGLPLPTKIRDAPVLQPGLELYLRAFHELDASRSFGMGEGPIPWGAIEQWCVAVGMTEEEAEDVHYLVRQLDNAYLRHKAEKAKTK